MEKESIWYKAAKKYIRKMLMPKSLQYEFQKNGMDTYLEKVYQRTAKLLEDNQDSNKALQSHLQQILPCIAFYEVLIEKEGNREKALEVYDQWSLLGMEKAKKSIQNLMKIPGLYRLTPGIFNYLIDKMFGAEAGFQSKKVPGVKGFARDMVLCPYQLTCKKYGYPELTQFFCKSDDITYGSMHPKLVWGRTKTLGRGDDYCDFRLFIKNN